MAAVDPHASVASLVTERPSRSRVLESFDIDYCCGGQRSLLDASRDAGVELGTVVGELERVDAASDEPVPEWSKAGLAELVDHLEATHHQYMQQALPRLDELLAKVIDEHAERHGELHEVRRTFDELRADVEPHLMKEEQVLFPICRELEVAEQLPSFHCGSVSNPIGVMRLEHDTVGALLRRLRSLTDGYQPPDDACPSYRALYAGLAELEDDLHLHIHKENNVLFPAAEAREQELAEVSGPKGG